MIRKRRTRQHVLAELSANFVERHVLLCGHSVERVEHDYGIDLILFTYDSDGEIENGQVFIQLKATDHVRELVVEDAVSFRLRRSDLDLWLAEPMPCILVVYDAARDKAYWLYLQAYFEDRRKFRAAARRGTVTVRIPRVNLVGTEAIRTFVSYRDDVLGQMQGTVRHHA